MRTLRTGVLTAALFVLVFSGRSTAQSTEAAATALFDDARKLMSAHRYAEACPKFAESQRLAPSGGTLINLAECYERNGQTASAWVAWKNAAARADAAGKADVEKKALARAAILEPALAKLVIVVAPESDVPGLEVKRDGVTVGRAEFGVSIPVDAGPHLIEAAAPRHKALSITAEVAPAQPEMRVSITLTVETTASPPTAAPPATPSVGTTAPVTAAVPDRPAPAGGSAQRTLGLITMGVGVAGVAVGSVFGLSAMSKNNEALNPQNCRTSTLCTQTGLSLTSEAKDQAMLSNIGFAVGAAALAGGAALFLTAPATASPAAARLRIVPALARSYGGASLEGAW